MPSLLNVLQDKLSGKNVKIVLPEGEDERVLTAAVKLHSTDYVEPIVLGDAEKVQSLADDKGLDISGIEITFTTLNKSIYKFWFQVTCFRCNDFNSRNI